MRRRRFLQGAVAASVSAVLRPSYGMELLRGAAAPTRYLGLQPGGPPSYYDTEMAFLNLLKSGGASINFLNCPWYTSLTTNGTLDTQEEAYLPLDTNGYPTSLVSTNIGNGAPPTQVFNAASMWLHLAPSWELWNGQTYYYPPGEYRVKWIGQGTLEVTGDATFSLTNSEANTYTSGTFTVTAPTNSTGLKLLITAINATASSFTGLISGTTLTASSVTGNLGAGNVVNGTGIAYQTTIVQQLSGTTGGAGTYEVNISQTVASESMTATDHPRDISVVQSAYAADYDAGAIFNPAWLALYQGIGCFRGMQWNKGIYMYVDYYVSGTFSLAQGATSMTLPNSKVWEGPSGTYTIWFYGGQSVEGIFTYGSATVTWATGLADAVSSSDTEPFVIIWPPEGWDARTPTTYCSYSMSPMGVPEEIILAAANALGADAWLCPRLDADSTYIGNLATLIDTTLNAGKKAYVEPSNEVWNGDYSQSALAQMMGCAQWPSQSNTFTQNRNWYGVVAAINSEIIYSTLGASKVPSRVVPMIGAQTGNVGTMTESMNTTYWTSAIDGYSGPASAHKIAGICTAYYFGPGDPGSGTGQISTADATTLIGVSDPKSEFFALQTSNVGTVANGSVTYSSLSFTGYDSEAFEGFQGGAQSARLYDKATAATYSLPLYGYEVGDDFNNDNSVVDGWGTLVVECEQDTRMIAMYQGALDWERINIGSDLLVLFSDAQQPATTGSFGLAMSVMQTLNATNTPKWQAVQNYIEGG